MYENYEFKVSRNTKFLGEICNNGTSDLLGKSAYKTPKQYCKQYCNPYSDTIY